QQAVVELFVAFAGRSHVNVEVENFGPSAFFDQVRQLEGVHAADFGTPAIGVDIARSDAMDDAHRLGPLAVTKDDLPCGRTSGIDQALHFQRGVYVWVTPIAIMRIAGGIEGLEPRS